jgi:hypothetical protein
MRRAPRLRLRCPPHAARSGNDCRFADAVLATVPLYNFGVAQHVKVWIDLTVVEREFTLVGVNPALDDFKDLAAQLRYEAHSAARDAGRALAAAPSPVA